MTTTTVRKGAGRPAAKARRTKAEQRTPLPGDVKVSVVAEVQSTEAQNTGVETKTAQDNLDSLGLPELRQLAKAKSWPSFAKANKATLIKALRENPDGPTDAAIAEVNEATAQTESKVDTPATDKSNEDKSGETVSRRIAAARENGFSRKDISDASGLTQSVIWRMQAKAYVKSAAEFAQVTAALDKIEAGEVKRGKRGRQVGSTSAGTKNELQSKLDKVHEVLSEVPMNSNSVTEYRDAITKALDVIDDNA